MIRSVSLSPAVPGEVVIGSIPVVLPIGTIALAVVRYQVVESEAIVSNHKVDAVVWLPTQVRPLSKDPSNHSLAGTGGGLGRSG